MTKRVLVTGGGSGIGRAIAEKFLADGCRIAICDADPYAAAAFASDHTDAFVAVADVTSEKDMDSFLTGVEANWEGIDVVCANAGTGGPAGPIESIPFDQWQQCVATNVHGAYLTCRWASRVMKAQRSGLITITSSTAGIMGYPLRSPYASAKWALIGLAKTLAMELGPYGVRVNAICPGSVEGDRMDRVIANEAAARNVSEDEIRASYVAGVSMKTWVNAQDIANSIHFLASDAAGKISGQVLCIDGHTETIAP